MKMNMTNKGLMSGSFRTIAFGGLLYSFDTAVVSGQFMTTISFLFQIVIEFFGKSPQSNKKGLGIVFTLYSILILISFAYQGSYLVKTEKKNCST